MPELPEVETVRRQVAPGVLGRTVVGASVSWPRLVREPGAAALVRTIRGLTFGPVKRHGKQLLFDLSDDQVLLAHLGMTGHFRILPADGTTAAATSVSGKDDRHVIARFAFDDGSVLAYIDPRRFGRMRLTSRASLDTVPEIAELGPDPLAPGFTAERFAAILATTRRMIRECLLDQRRVAGLGNIYVAEALYHARVNPCVPSREVKPEDVKRLHAEIRALLQAAIRSRGSTILSYRDSEGNRGEFAARLAVYGREGEPCPRCGVAITREVRNGRSSFYCRSCQRGTRPGHTRQGSAHPARTTRAGAAGRQSLRRRRRARGAGRGHRTPLPRLTPPGA